MLSNDTIQPQISKVELLIYEGELTYDADGQIVNKLQQSLIFNHQAPPTIANKAKNTPKKDKK